MNLVIIGLSGAGKGTQADLIAQKYGLQHLSTGEMFRTELEKRSPEGLAAYEYWKEGKWVPDDVTFSLLKLYLDESKSGFILDGFPRTLKQCEILNGYLNKSNQTTDWAIYLQVSPEESLKRLKLRAEKDMVAKGKSRLDETEDVIKKRFQSFIESVEPVLNYYRSQGKLLEVNGERSVEKIFQEIDGQLQQKKLE
ncbi:nucleoside monophosphate kinase [Candidatus Microgenomates bacterium]|nr:nucleoside monophosphate kinase [Candidatus Microgenomates bacterium]